ncbi:MAG: helix-turn-helix domain-containing protein [Clostridia bacterium]|nr:helix-turn-helix domain-containing protein [Clostridia bacterium]
MKDKNLGISILNQLYGSMLTEKQFAMLKAYYDFDCSLAEIADEYGISRQAVRDNIKRAENSLVEFEKQFRLLATRQNVVQKLNQLKELLEEKNFLSDDVLQKIAEAEKALEGE